MTIVTLTTDFGLVDPFVGIMKGVLASRAPAARLVDVTHGIPPQDVLAGALALRHAAPYFPAGTIHVAVVDPGVGTARRPLCVETASALFVGPDNGVLSLAAPADAIRRIVELTDERFFLEPQSRTFHGRDVFAPVAAALATGTTPGALGADVAEMVRIAPPRPVVETGRIRGEIIYVDGFGNLVTNVDEPTLARGGRGSVVVRGTRTRGVQRSYAAVARGEPVAVVNSWGLVEIAVRDGSAAKQLSAGVGEPVTIEAE